MHSANGSARVSKAEIISAAAEVFMRRGFEAASVREIAREAGVSQGTLYYHIGSKANVLLELHDSFHDEMLAKLCVVEAADSDAPDKLGQFMKVMLEAVEKNKTLMTIYLRERRALPDEATGHIRVKKDRIDSIVANILEQGRREGYWREFSLRSARLAIFGMVSWAVEWLDPSGPLTGEELAHDFTDLALNGMLRRGSAELSLADNLLVF